MAPLSMSWKRSFDQAKTVPLKSRKRLVVAVTIFLSTLFLLRSRVFDPIPISSTISSSSFGISNENSLDESVKPVREDSVPDPVSVPDSSVQEDSPVVEEVSTKVDEGSAPVSDAGIDIDDVSESDKEVVEENETPSDDVQENETSSGEVQESETSSHDAQENETSSGDAQENETSSDDETVPRGEPGKCLKHVLYDKPVKTGSTAIAFAIRELLGTMGEKDKSCAGDGPLSCVERAKSICNGTIADEEHFSILGHLRFGGRELAECLRPNYYVVTSVREPYQRRKSAYLWNRTLNATHFAIPYTASFQEFMNRMPRCQLYHYYDGRGMHCDVGMPLEERIQDIVDRVDEVIDIYDEPAGPLHKRIARYVRRENESIKIDEKDYLEEFDQDTLKEEQLLYDRLRAKRLQPPKEGRLLC